MTQENFTAQAQMSNVPNNQLAQDLNSMRQYFSKKGFIPSMNQPSYNSEEAFNNAQALKKEEADINNRMSAQYGYAPGQAPTPAQGLVLEASTGYVPIAKGLDASAGYMSDTNGKNRQVSGGLALDLAKLADIKDANVTLEAKHNRVLDQGGVKENGLALNAAFGKGIGLAQQGQQIRPHNFNVSYNQTTAPDSNPNTAVNAQYVYRF